MEILLRRKHIRLEGFDYSQNGAYFITICAHQRAHLFGDINVGQGLCSCLPAPNMDDRQGTRQGQSPCPTVCRLSEVGIIIDNEINELALRYHSFEIDKYTIMPNHIHLILSIGPDNHGSPCPKVSDAIRTLKSKTTKQANIHNETPGRKIWQFRYHDHIIRNADEYQRIWQYIDTNPQKWNDDCYFA